ncbi:MAG: bifunctional DNA-formamidopyrimidine glycosylase/DNA-(apurinic or apyrimidinic site) lyase, partial [Candidatus Daviesbacteria bacterium]|nr:bifunctional DNA-formamidopyrimidine glycosylase/DNA-(apurinic or apyrimidinic site) lyase [Candidatus Daviesbacteria bacterium]
LMPELPEVETIRIGLQKKIIGLKIQKIQVLSPKSFIGNPNLAEGQIILKIWRKAKILGMELSGDMTLLFHLKMSGQLVYEDEKRPALPDASRGRFIGGHPTEDMLGTMPNSHTRVIFSFVGGSHLYFNDQRKFGWVKVVDRLQVTGDSSIKNLGPEPLEKEFTWQILKQNLLKHKKMSVKVAIMDQSVVSGVGNIYANESCFNAKIDPRTKVGEMSDNQFKNLYSGIIEVLKAGIKYGGSTRVHFVDPEGHKGYFLDYAFVYWRDKHPCKVCGTEIKKISLGGRGTYLCPSCQKAV